MLRLGRASAYRLVMLRLLQRTPSPLSARSFLPTSYGCPGAQLSTFPRGSAVHTDGRAERGSASRGQVRTVSSSAGGDYPQVPPDVMARLNRTSVSLYRLLLKDCRNAQVSGAKSGQLILQPHFDLRDQGAARWLDSAECSAWPPPLGAKTEDSGSCDEGRAEGAGSQNIACRIIDAFLHWTSEVENLDEEEQKLAGKAAMLIARNVELHHLDFSPTKRSTGSGKDHDTTWEHILASSADISSAVRKAFLRVSAHGEDKELRESLTKNDIIRLHRKAIDAVGWMHYQRELAQCTSVTENVEKGIRVVATSRYTGYNPSNGHWFAYRLRVENFRNESESDESDDKAGGSVQLLGRYWEIHELKDDSIDSDDNPTIVPAPSTGAVGHHPVIRPGEIFEYMSQAKIVTADGKMSGKFYMADVTEKTKNGNVGDPIEALRYPKGDERLFEAEVGPFPLSVPLSEREDGDRKSVV